MPSFSSSSLDEISNEGLKCLYGTSRSSEIEDVINNVSKKETTAVNIDESTKKSDRDSTQEEEFKVPNFKDMVNYIWDQMQKRKKGSNAKHRFVISNQVLQFHPMTYQEVICYTVHQPLFLEENERKPPVTVVPLKLESIRVF